MVKPLPTPMCTTQDLHNALEHLKQHQNSNKTIRRLIRYYHRRENNNACKTEQTIIRGMITFCELVKHDQLRILIR